MAVRNYSNITNVGTLSGAVGTGDTTLPINGGWSNLPAFPFYVIVDRGAGTEEDMLATGGNATALDVTRGYDGSPASSHGVSATVEVAVLAEFFNKADQHVEASTNVHGLAGGAAVVGTTSTQTLTNKTINASVLNLAHTTSPAASQAIQVSADAATSRDGFVWNKTVAATGNAFKAVSSGTTRYQVDADGKVTLNSTTGTDKALSVQQSGTERTFIQNDGHADFALQAGGATVDRVRIRTQSTQNALAIKDSGAFNVFTIGGSGNVDASGYVAAVGNVSSSAAVSSGTTLTAGTNLTVNGTAAVTGTSTLTGDVTLPLPASSTTPRLIINSRTGGVIVRGRNQGGTTTFEVAETGQLSLNQKALIYNTASPVVAQVSGTGVIASPSTEMLAFDSSDFGLKRYNGSTWDTVGRYSTALANPIGLIGGQYRGSDTAAINTTETQFVSSGTIALLASSLYQVDLFVGYNTTVADDRMFWKIRDTNTSGTIRAQAITKINTAGLPFYTMISLLYKTTSAEASRSFIGSVVRDAGTGNVVVQAASSLVVKYLGPSSLVTTI